MPPLPPWRIHTRPLTKPGHSKRGTLLGQSICDSCLQPGRAALARCRRPCRLPCCPLHGGTLFLLPIPPDLPKPGLPTWGQGIARLWRAHELATRGDSRNVSGVLAAYLVEFKATNRPGGRAPAAPALVCLITSLPTYLRLRSWLNRERGCTVHRLCCREARRCRHAVRRAPGCKFARADSPLQTRFND